MHEYMNPYLRRYYAPEEDVAAVGDRGQVASKTLLDGRRRIAPEAIPVGRRIRSIVGLGISATHIIDAEDGLIVVDTGLSVTEGEAKMRLVRTFSDKPVRAVIYTHHHYSLGTTAFLPDDRRCEVYAHERCDSNRADETASIAPAKRYRLIAQAGRVLPPDGPDADSAGTTESHPGPPGYVRPTQVFCKHGRAVTILGVRLTVFTEYPFDTDCTLLLWLPDDRTMIHNHLSSNFPNVYSIGGCRFRDPQPWLSGLDEIRRRRPEYLIGCHGLPVIGEEAVADTVCTTRDALQFVYDQTVRGINSGLSPAELIDAVRLPPQLADHPMLSQTYGEVWHHVLAIYAGLLGWYDGNATGLIPLHPQHEAGRIVEGFGGVQPALRAAESALDEGDPAWCARLCEHILRVQPDSTARELQSRALRQAAHRTPAWGSRNALLTQALELEDVATRSAVTAIPSVEAMLQLPEGTSLEYLRYRVDPVRAENQAFALEVQFTGSTRRHIAVLRDCVLDTSGAVAPDEKAPLITVEYHRRAWIERVLHGRPPADEPPELTRALSVFAPARTRTDEPRQERA